MSIAQNRTTSRTTLKIFQANVDKGEGAHCAALQLAFQEGYNIVLIQEPNTSYNAQKARCPSNQFFQPIGQSS
jgi:hypothetical protein